MKPEQVEGTVALIKGRDVFAILPTGFGKSLLCLLASGTNCSFITDGKLDDPVFAVRMHA